MLHAKKIMKMANCVSGSVHASPLGILAAEYAKHTFHPSNIGEESTGIDELRTSRYRVNDPSERKGIANSIRNTRADASRFGKTGSKKANQVGMDLQDKAFSRQGMAAETYMLAGERSFTLADKQKARGESIDEVNPNHPVQNPDDRAYAANVIKQVRSAGKAASSRKYRQASDLDDIAYGEGPNPNVGPELSKTFSKAGDRSRNTAGKLFQRGESIEAIVDKFIEDTMTGDVASMALGFAPTGEMDPHEGHGKKKKKKNQFDRLSDEMSGKGNRANMKDHGARSMFSRLARKVSGNMSGV
jgi:hypothetical protein